MTTCSSYLRISRSGTTLTVDMFGGVSFFRTTRQAFITMPELGYLSFSEASRGEVSGFATGESLIRRGQQPESGHPGGGPRRSEAVRGFDHAVQIASNGLASADGAPASQTWRQLTLPRASSIVQEVRSGGSHDILGTIIRAAVGRPD